MRAGLANELVPERVVALSLRTLEDVARLAESTHLECKLAAGPNGKGRLPNDFWPTYSAFANTQGGVVVLGLRERAGRFAVHGVAEPERVTADLFSTANNPQKVSTNLLSDSCVQRVTVDGQTLLAIQVPAATRRQRPVYLNGNPLGGNTYRRLHEGDQRCDDETVRRMICEQMYDTRDQFVLNGFSLPDVNLDSLKAFRNRLRVYKLGHPWAELDDLWFLTLLGGWRCDRDESREGLTIAGLLMFGEWPSIHEALPNYFVDYQERTSLGLADECRWLDRVVPDGTWSGNLFDFYFRVLRRITADIKVPFVLEDGVRVDETPLHRTLMEALVNTLVHADYTDRASVLVVKDPGGFTFRNPGTLRVPPHRALRGGESDCRNRTLQQMFLMIGFGERAGSGLAKIQHGLQSAGGTLRLFDSFEPYDQTRLELTLEPAKSQMSEKTTVITSEKVSEKTGERILTLLRSSPRMSTEEMAAVLRKTRRTVERAIVALKTARRLERVGPDKGGQWVVLDSD